MKFKVEGDLEFEAQSSDAAFLKLALFFLSQMEHKPMLTSPTGNKPFDEMLAMLADGELTADATAGGIALDFVGLHEPPRMMQ